MSLKKSKILQFSILMTIVSSISSEIIFVFEQFRHGARGSVFATPPNYVDRYNVLWGGNGELTGVGMRMHYLLGVRNRIKYKNLISSKYDPREILVMSTDQNRTILSAQSQLLGMFPPESGIELEPGEIKKAVPPNPMTEQMQKAVKKLKTSALPQKMQVIPIHLFNKEEKKYYTLTEPSECPAMKRVKELYQNKEVVKKFYRDFNQTYGEKLMRYFKQNDTNFLFNYINMLGITDHFISNYAHYKNLTKFMEYGFNLKEFYQKCKDFKTLSNFEIESDTEIGVMATSPTIMKIVTWMEKRIDFDIKNQTIVDYAHPKFVMYSGHDFTVAPMEQFLSKAFGTGIHYPDFAANQFFELHRIEGVPRNTLNHSHYYVEYYYNDVLGINITFDEFKRKVLDTAWSIEKINLFCNRDQTDFMSFYFYFFLIVSLALTILILIRRHKRAKMERDSTTGYISQEYDM